jgi:hypothetical protein
MTVHDVGARLPAGFQDANYFAQGGHATSERTLSCSYLYGSVAMGRPREIVPLCASSFRAARPELQRFPRFRPVSADGSGTVSSVTVSSSPSA